MLKVKVTIRDLDGIDAQVEDVISAIDSNLSETAYHVFNEAKTTLLFNDKTGNLRRSIRLRKSKYPDGGYIVSARGKNRGEGTHAHLVEFGHTLIAFGRITHKRVPAIPFMRTALEKGIQHALESFRGE